MSLRGNEGKYYNIGDKYVQQRQPLSGGRNQNFVMINDAHGIIYKYIWFRFFFSSYNKTQREYLNKLYT